MTSESKSLITIRGGVGIINHEWVTDNVRVEDIGPDYRARQMWIDLHNGYGMSVVFGSCTYSTNHDHGLYPDLPFQEEVSQAEIAIMWPGHGLVDPFSDEWGDSVLGYCDAETIVKWIVRARQLESVNT
jgi:hypothetical protein